MGGKGLIFTPVLVRRLIGPPGLSRPMTSTSWTHSYSKQVNTVNLTWLQSSMREPWWLQCLKSLLLEILFATTWSVFQNQVTYAVKTMLKYAL